MTIFLIVLSLISDISAAVYAFSDAELYRRLLVFSLFHFIASISASYAMYMMLPPKMKESQSPYLAVGFMFLMCMFLPVVGFVGLFVCVVVAMNLPRKKDEVMWIHNPREELPSHPRDMMYTKLGTGALQDILLNAPDTDRRVEAISSVSHLPRDQRISFYKIALRDPADDVRLMAYSQLDPIEQDITDNIKRLEDSFEQNNSADIAYDIAEHSSDPFPLDDNAAVPVTDIGTHMKSFPFEISQNVTDISAQHIISRYCLLFYRKIALHSHAVEVLVNQTLEPYRFFSGFTEILLRLRLFPPDLSLGKIQIHHQ